MPTRRRRLLFVNHVDALGGAENSLLDAVRGLDRARYDLHAVLPGPGPLAQRLADLGVRLHRLPLRRLVRTRNPFRLLGALVNVTAVAFRLARLMEKERIELVHSNSTTAHLYAGLAARRAGVPCIWHCRDLADPGRLGPLLAATADRVIAISRAVARRLEGIARPGQVTTLYNPLDAEAWTPGEGARSESGPVIGMAAQMEPWKRHDLFLRAAARLAREEPAARFIIAGGNPFGGRPAYADSLRRLAAELGLADRVEFLGHRDDMRAVLSSCDVLVHPAGREPLGRVILEAMALGKPVVAVEAAGPAEIIRNGTDGVLAPPDDPAAMAAAVLGLLRDPARALDLGRAARERVRSDFTVARHVSGLESLYASLLPAPRPPAVAFVVDTFPSVSETFILRELMALEEQGVRPVLFARRRPASPCVHADARPYLKTVRYGGWRPGRALFSRAGLRLLAKALAEGDPERGSRARMLARLVEASGFADRARREGAGRVHAHFAHATADVGRLMANLLEAPFSLSVHAWDLYTQDPRALRARLEGASFVACCTGHGRQTVRERVPGFPPSRLVLVRHGLFPERYAPGEPVEPLVLAVGRLEEKKGFDVLIEACQRLKERNVPFRGEIVGAGSGAAALAGRIAAAGLSDTVTLVGEQTQEHLMERYRRARVVAVPSKAGPGGDSDGLPNVLLEAMAMGVPVVASSFGAIPEAVDDGVQGLLVPPDDPASLASALGRVLADPGLRRRLGAAGREKVLRDFDVRRHAETWATLFRERA